MKDRVRLQQDPDHIGVWPDRPAGLEGDSGNGGRS
jgi:hypothetical protein